MSTINNSQAADVISDEYRTSRAIVEVVSEEVVEDYLKVSPAPSGEDILG